jgi:hypothetical protein
MVSEEEIRARKRRQAEEAAAQASEELSTEFEALKAATAVDIENLKPQVSDADAYDQLIAAVQQATANNESIAEFKNRLKALGENVVAVWEEVKPLLPT